MARKNGPTPEDLEFSSQNGSTRSGMDFYAGREFDDGETIDPARLSDEPDDQESPFLRTRKRVPVRRGPLPKKAVNWLKIVIVAVLAIGCAAGILYGAITYLENSWRFSIDSSDAIQISGNENVTRDEVLAVFGEDVSRNIFKIPLEQRRQKLEEIPWVDSAVVMRYLPNRLAVVIKERTPVAFVQMDTRIALIDASGVVMEPPGEAKFSFPVLTGFSESEPLSTRAPRMKIFSNLMRDLDSGGKNYSQDVSDVDLTDPKNIKITVGQGSVVIHATASGNFLEQYEKYLAIVSECRARVGTGRLDVDASLAGQVPCRPLVEVPEGQSTPETQAAVEEIQPKPPAPVVAKAVKPVAHPAHAKHKTKKR